MPTLYGRPNGHRRGIGYLYSARSNALFNSVKVSLLVLLSPIWLPFYLMTWIGYWSEIITDWMEPKLEQALVKVIPRKL